MRLRRGHRGADTGDVLDLIPEPADLVEAAVALLRADELVVPDPIQTPADLEQAGRVAIAVGRWVSRQPTDDRQLAVLSGSHRLLSAVFGAAGDAVTALDHAVRAVRADPGVQDAARVLALLRLAEALDQTGDRATSRDRYHQAETMAAQLGAGTQLVAVLASRIRVELAAGDDPATGDAVHSLGAVADDSPQPLAPWPRDALAAGWLRAGRVEAAEQLLRAGLGLLGVRTDADLEPAAAMLRLRLSVALRRMRRVHEAEQLLAGCLEVADRRLLPEMGVTALGELAELFAEREAYPAAYATHRRYHQAWREHAAARQGLAGRLRSLLYEATEARRQVEHYRDQARRDDLTGLRNRRFVDEELPRRLVAAQLGEPGSGMVGSEAAGLGPAAPVLVAAIVDIDHFKRVNDTFSHQVGDQVMRTIAGVMTRALIAVQPAGSEDRAFLARLGGEEFAVVLSGPAAEAVAVLNGLRLMVAGYDWSSLTPGLSVTVSIGMAVAGPADTQLSLLSRADRLMYAAKAAGRDRVLAEPAPGALP